MTTDDRRTIERAYLEFVEGTSSKFYAVVRLGHADGTESVHFNFGRIGFPRGWDERVRRVGPAAASAAYASLVGEKRRKGYRDAAWPDSLAEPAGGPDPLAPPYVSGVAGILPGEGAAIVGGVALPSGTPVESDLIGEGEGLRALWLTDEPVPGVSAVWTRLAAAFPVTGLWPIIVDNPDLGDVLDRPASPSADPVAGILESCWEANLGDMDEDATEELSPYSRGFPGPAAPTTGTSSASVFTDVAAELKGRIGLVAVARPADTVAAIGWQGWANYGSDPGQMAAVFRSWEERFGAVLVGLRFDTLVFAVARPARNQLESTPISAEHMAICPDNVWQGAGSIREYAASLVHAQAWMFWWD